MCGLGILLLAGVSFFFSLAETALGALPRWEVRRLAESFPRRGPLVQRLAAQPEEVLATTALGNTFAVGAILLLTLMLAADAPDRRWLAVLGASVGVLALCEVVPKALAVRAPARWALRVAFPMAAVQGEIG
ncbi:MAG: CNNM domain-containing protein, partial [Limisphaerales bacterium]